MKRLLASLAVVEIALATAVPGFGQVGAGLLDANTATVQELTALPHMTDALAAGLIDARPFASVVELNTFLTGNGLSAEQVAELYTTAFVHVDLNTGSSEEIQLIPGAGRRMAHEFDEYRPWSNWAHFDREIGKYVDENEVARLWRYVVIE